MLRDVACTEHLLGKTRTLPTSLMRMRVRTREGRPGDVLTQTNANCFFDLEGIGDFTRLEMCSKARYSDGLIAALLTTQAGG